MQNQNQVLDVISEYLPRTTVSQWHAMVSGYIVGRGDDSPEIWTHVLLDQVVHDEVLNGFFSQVLECFNDDALSYDLILPRDDEALSIRSQALVEWVRHFLSSMGAASVLVADELSQSVNEILRDLNSVAELDYKNIDAGEDNEAHFLEVCEYVRVLVMTLFVEMGQ